MPKLSDLRKEVFVALLLDGKNRLIRRVRVSEGSLTSSVVHPREAFLPAVRASAAAVIFAHNHPSGDPTPSREDISITEQLRQAGQILGISVLDHLIIGENSFSSLAEEGLL
jgi:DNA repair protein RadC